MSDTPAAGEPKAVNSRGVPAWVLVLLGVLLAAILALVGATLYVVSQIEDDTAQATETARTVAATKAVLDLVAARQLKSQDTPEKVEAAVAGMTTLLNETQAALTATNEAIASTNETLDQTNALLDQAEAVAIQAQQAAVELQSRLDEVGQGQQALADKLDQALARIQTRLTTIANRLEQLPPR